MRYLIFSAYIMLISSCLQPETEANLVLDTSAYDIFLTIARDLKTAELNSTIEDVPKKIPFTTACLYQR